MTEKRLLELLSGNADRRILTVGDFCLHKRLITQSQSNISSQFTNHQSLLIQDTQNFVEAGGNIAQNLCALGFKTTALSILGDDGEGYELIKFLRAKNVCVDYLITDDARNTPTTITTIVHEQDNKLALINRMNIVNYKPLSKTAEQRLIALLQEHVPEYDGVVIADYFSERNEGLISSSVRSCLIDLAKAYPNLIFIADTVNNAHLFERVVLKASVSNAISCFDSTLTNNPTQETILWTADLLYRRTQKPIFMTQSKLGITVYDGKRLKQVPAVPPKGEIEPLGGGSVVTASLMCALLNGASPLEAAQLSQLAGHVVVHKLGITGSASPDELIKALKYALSVSWQD